MEVLSQNAKASGLGGMCLSISIPLLWAALIGLLACLNPVAAQAPAHREQTGAASQDPVLRFTPEMARALARQYTQNMLIRRYNLDPAKAEEVTEAVARRFMATAHQVDEKGADLVDYMSRQIMKMSAEGNGPVPRITPQLGTGMGERLLPLIPALRDLVRDVSSDVRPMLSFKEQLKLTADVAVAGTAINAFEENMQRWSKGEAQPFDNPFEQQRVAVQRDETGLSKEAKRAKRSAETVVKGAEWNRWSDYVEQAKKLYDFEPSQAAAADSLLREYTARAAALGSADWRDQIYRNNLWYWMLMNMRMGWGNLLFTRLEEQRKQINEPINLLAIDFKTRIDQLPTAAQRTAADTKINALLAEKGLTSTSTEPAP